MIIYNYDGSTGRFLGTSEADPDPLLEGDWLIPACATTVSPPAPKDGNYIFFQDGAWAYEVIPEPEEPVEPEPLVPSAISSRQFRIQLFSSGLLDQVNTWVARQEPAVQIAYEYSGTFVRSEPMMAAGFTSMGFTDQQIDAFFTSASKL